MSSIRLVTQTTPATPSSGNVEVYPDSADGRVKQIDSGGVVSTLSNNGTGENTLYNGGFNWAQRQVAATLTSYAASADRVYGPDRWGLSNQTSSLQYAQVDTSGTPATGLQARYYGQFKQITGAGKALISQVLEATNTMPLRNRTVRFSFKARYAVAASLSLRFGLLENQNAATADTVVNPWTTAWGANGTDPTWGANLAKIAPVLTEANGTIASTAVTATLTAAFVRYSATFVVPSNSKNLIAAIWTNNQLAVNDELHISEVCLTDGPEILDWTPRPLQQDLDACLRYYCKTFPLATAPAQSAGVAGGLRGSAVIAGAVATSSVMQWRFPIPMRTTPTLVYFNPSANNAFVRNVPAATDATATASANATADCVDINCTGLAGWTVGQELKVHATAAAEI